LLFSKRKKALKKKILNTLKYLLFFLAGVALFLWVYKDVNLKDLRSELGRLNYWWLALSFFLGLFSHISRAYRWNMLIEPLGYKPRPLNSFLAVMTMYFVNLLVPRAGEVFRCTVLSKYEQIPLTSLVGTVFTERVTDLITLALVATVILLSQVGVFETFLANNPGVSEKIGQMTSNPYVYLFVGLCIAAIAAFFLFRNSFRKFRFAGKIYRLLHSFAEGIKTIIHLKSIWAYIGHTAFIYLMWLVMLYVVFFSYPPTSHLTLGTGMVAFVMGGLAMIAPVQGGIGAWHFMVYQTLFIYGIPMESAKIFALIAWTTTNLALTLVGLIALLLLPVVNKDRSKSKIVL